MQPSETEHANGRAIGGTVSYLLPTESNDTLGLETVVTSTISADERFRTMATRANRSQLCPRRANELSVLGCSNT